MKRFTAIFLSIVTLLCVIIPSYAVERSQSDVATADTATTTRIDNENVETLKTVIHNGGDDYTLRLETYVTGQTVIEEVVTGIPMDIVLVMDHSNSMYQCIDCDKSVNPTTKIYSDALDTNTIYYMNSSTTKNPLYYCSECGKWYTERHSEIYHGGVQYIPKASNTQDIYVKQFYTQYANVYCGASCTHANYKHPIYEAGLDITQTYYRTANKNNPVVYCSECKCWYNTSNTKHVAGGTHISDFYYPFSVADDTKSAGQFYTTTCVPQHIALEMAVEEFLDTVYTDAKGSNGVFDDANAETCDDIEHRVAMVSFAGDNSDASNTATNCILSFYDPNVSSYGDDRLTGPRIAYNKIDSENDDYYPYYYEHSLQNVTEIDRRSILDTTFNNIRLSGETHTYKGMIMAKNIFNYDETYKSEIEAGKRKRVVILISDGVPYVDSAFDKANTALQESYEIKNNFDAEVYAIATFAGADGSDPVNIPPWSGGETNKANRFMHLVSSNYPYAKYCNPNNDNAVASDYNINPELKTGQSYYLDAADQSALQDIFLKIYSEINSSMANESLGPDAVLKDIVTSQFVISGAPSVYTEVYNGYIDGIIQWVEDSDKDNTAVVNVSGNTVTVTGFDYSKYYVNESGVMADHTGKKLILEIPIKPAPGNNGGTEMITNEEGSGIYYPDEDGKLEPVEEYNVPKADIPTTITVVKNIVGGDITEFEFNASVQHLASYDGNDQSDGNYLDQVDGVQTHSFKLTNNGSHVIENVAVGTTFMIAENADTEDYSVSVIVTDGNGNDVTATALTVSDGVYTIAKVVPSMTITFTNTIKHADLVINKVITGTDEPDQDFIFEITNTDTGTSMNLVISASDFTEGKGSVTVERMLLGNYTVKELTAWSNRYTLKCAVAAKNTSASLNGNAIAIKLTNVGETLTFTNERTEELWLSGDSYAENYFADSGVVRKD